MAGGTLLIDGVYWPNVGHAVEALHHAWRYRLANPRRRIELVLNRHTAVELATLCPWLDAVHEVDLPDRASRVTGREWRHLPRRPDHVLFDPRADPLVAEAMEETYLKYHRGLAAWIRPTAGVGYHGDGSVPYDREAHLSLPVAPAHLDLPVPRIAVMPGGGGPAEEYPSRRSWEAILDALAEHFGDIGFLLVGRMEAEGPGDRRTLTRFEPADMDALIARHPNTVSAVGLPMLEQLAQIAACDAFLSPHTGFAFAVLAAGTPWLTVSGGRWSEYFMAGVPFHSVLPDPERYPCYQERHRRPVEDPPDGPRVPSMVHRRILEDLPRLVRGADALVHGEWEFAECERRHWTALEDHLRVEAPA